MNINMPEDMNMTKTKITDLEFLIKFLNYEKLS